MEALITEKIQKQGFELVLEQLGAILFLEISNQIKLNCIDTDFEIFVERQEPYDNSEGVMVNVSLGNINYSNHNESSSEGNEVFNVDIYSNGSASIKESGNDNVRRKIHLFAGWIRYILSSTKYKTLAFAPGTIGGTYLDSIQFEDNYGSQDASFNRFARLQFSARVFECQDMDTGINLEGNDSVIKLCQTDKGYKFIFNN